MLRIDLNINRNHAEIILVKFHSETRKCKDRMSTIFLNDTLRLVFSMSPTNPGILLSLQKNSMNNRRHEITTYDKTKSKSWLGHLNHWLWIRFKFEQNILMRYGSPDLQIRTFCKIVKKSNLTFFSTQSHLKNSSKIFLFSFQEVPQCELKFCCQIFT